MTANTTHKKSLKTVLLVEDDEPTRLRLIAVINANPQLVISDACGTVEEALKMLSQQRPDVLLTDLGLPDGNGAEIIRKAKLLYDRIEIMVISIFGDERNVLAAIKAGASGYILKDGDTEYIGKAILRLLAGESPISAAIARHLLKHFYIKSPHRPQPKMSHPSSITDREKEVLNSISKGYTYKETAHLIGISHHTVATHIKKIYRKLAVKSRSQAIYEASQLGIVDIKN